MRKTDGYCRRTGKYVNALAEKPCWLGSREEAHQNLPQIGPQEVPPTRYAHYCRECFNGMMAQGRAAYREGRAATAERIARKEPAPKKAKQTAAVGLDFRSIAALLIYTSGKVSSMHEAVTRADTLIEQLKEGRNS